MKKNKFFICMVCCALFIWAVMTSFWLDKVQAQSCGDKLLQASEACDLGTDLFQSNFVGPSDLLDRPAGLIFGPDGDLYLSDAGNNEVLRYDGVTGAFIDAFVFAGSGGLSEAAGITIGPNGDFYVSSVDTNEVLRYDGVTGAFIDVFVSAGSGGLNGPFKLFFGPFNILYVSSYYSNEVLRYDGVTGAFIDVFVSVGSGGLDLPIGMNFGPDGDFYVSSADTNEVLRYDGVTGAFIDVFVSAGSGGLNRPTDLVFGPDGNLYIGSAYSVEVLCYDGATGDFIDIFVDAVVEPYGLQFRDGVLYMTDLFGDRVVLKVLEGGNSDEPNAVCRLDCSEQRCGDGIVDDALGEFCDDGNTDNSDACLETCTIAICGDGFIQVGVEECDGGVDCDDQCFLMTSSGGVVNDDELEDELEDVGLVGVDPVAGGGCSLGATPSTVFFPQVWFLLGFILIRFFKK